MNSDLKRERMEKSLKVYVSSYLMLLQCNISVSYHANTNANIRRGIRMQKLVLKNPAKGQKES